MRHPSSLWIGACLAALAACNPGGSVPCTAGEQKTCGCPGGAPEGVQVCAADGTYGACDCGSSTTTSTGGNGTGAGGATGGNNTGGNSTGGNSTGGNSTGGNSTGGTGGNSTGGTGGSTGTTTPMPCDNVFQGSFTIQNTIDIGTISPYCEITGNLTVSAAGLAGVSLPNLRTLDGDLSVPGPLPSLDLPALEVGGALHVTADTVHLPSLVTAKSLWVKGQSVELPALVTATDGLSLNVQTQVLLPALTTTSSFSVYAAVKIDAPNITVVPGSVGFVTQNPAGIAVDAPKLTSAGSIGVLNGNSINLPVLATVGDAITITEGGAVLNVSFPALVTASQLDVRAHGMVSAPNLVTITTGDLRIKSWSGMSLPKLETVGYLVWVTETSLAKLDLPALKSIGAVLELGGPFANWACAGNPPSLGNPDLVELGLPSLTKLGAFNNGIFDMGLNPKLPQCRVDALINQLTASGWAGYYKNVQPDLCTLAAGPCP